MTDGPADGGDGQAGDGPSPRRVSLLSSIGWLSGGSIATRVVGAASGIITARMLGVDGRGELAIALVVGMIAGGVLPMGLDLWAARALGGGAELHSVRRLLGRQLGGAAVVVILGVAIASGLDRGNPALWVATGCLCITATVATMKLGVLQGLNELRRFSIANFVSTASYTSLLVVVLVADSATVTIVVIAAALSQLIIALWPAADRRLRNDATGPVNYRAAVRFGVPTAAGAVGAMLLYRLDIILVSAWSGVDAAGLYSVALAYTELVWVVPTAAAQALVPHAAKSDPTIDTARLSRSVMLLMVGAAAGLSLLGPAVVPWVFGSDFAGAVAAVVPLSVAAIAIGVWKLIGHDLIARGDAHSRLWSGVCGVAVLIGADAVLIPRFGVRGAAYGALIAYVTAAALVVGAWCRRFGSRPAHLLVPRRADVAYILRRTRVARKVTPPRDAQR